MQSPQPQIAAKGLASAERYRTLLEINNAIITNLTQESLLNAICEALQRVLPVYRAAISLYDRDSDTLRILALSTQWNSDYFRVGLEVNRNDSHSGGCSIISDLFSAAMWKRSGN